MYFPQQFEQAKADARRASRMNGAQRVIVGFNARVARFRFKHRAQQNNALKDPFVIYSLIPLTYRSQQARPMIEAIRASRPPQTAIVYSTKGKDSYEGERPTRKRKRAAEKRSMKPSFTGSYKRPKLPIIYWYQTEENEEELGKTILLVRGAGSAAWAKEHSLYNEDWQIWRNNAGQPVGAVLTLDGTDEWRKDARAQGLRNKTRFLEYPPTGSFFES